MRLTLLLTLATISFFLNSNTSTAQILNVEKNRLDRDSSNYWTGSISFDLLIHNRSATADNPVRYTGLSSNADLAYTSELNRYMIINQINYSAITGNAFISTGYSHIRTNFLWRRKLSYELFGQYQYDFGRGLENRFLSGGGIRISLYQKSSIVLALGLGIMYEQEKWKLPKTEDIFITTDFVKSTNYLALRWRITESARFNNIIYYQIGYDNEIDKFRNRISGEANLEFNLSKHLRFKTTFSAQYDNQPVVPINNFIYSLNNGIKVQF